MTSSPYRNPVLVDVYRRITAPVQFAQPARDLIELLKPMEGARVLDVGTGTGAVAQHMIPRAGKGGRVVGVDASIEMLQVARRTVRCAVVAGALPALPFRDGAFDIVAAGFVISHVADYEQALRDVVRVCRGQGRVGVTAWGSLPNPAAQLWSEIAGRFVPRSELDTAFRAHVPCEGLFSEPVRFLGVLKERGLASVSVETRVYRCRMPTADFLTSRMASLQGSILSDRLTADGRRHFENQVAEAFSTRFGVFVECDRDVHFGVGVRA